MKGRNVAPTELFDAARKSLHFVGYEGLSMIAASGLDMAAWDALARAANLPLCVLLGGTVGPVKSYRSRQDGGDELGCPTVWPRSPDRLDGRGDDRASMRNPRIDCRSATWRLAGLVQRRRRSSASWSDVSADRRAGLCLFRSWPRAVLRKPRIRPRLHGDGRKRGAVTSERAEGSQQSTGSVSG